MARSLVLDPVDVPAAPMTKTALILRLEGEEPPELDRYGFYDGQWVHTPHKVVLEWFGPGTYEKWPTGEVCPCHTNSHRVEGRLILGGPWPVVETTLVHPQPKYDWSPRRLAGKPVLFTVRRRECIAPGPLTDRRVIELDNVATGCNPPLLPPSMRLD